jgi:hypothetical protein
MGGQAIRSEVESVTTDPQQQGPLSWEKSAASGSSACVEVARTPGIVFVRDSKDPSGPALTFSSAEWKAFLIGACAGQFNIST